MGQTIYFTKNGIKLEKRRNSIFAVGNEEKRYYPLEQIDKIVLFGNIFVSNPLLNDLSYRNIPIYYYSYGGRFKGVFIPPEKNINKVRLFQYKTYFDKERRLDLAKKIILTASKNKLTILKRYYNKLKNDKILEHINSIKNLIKDLKECNSVDSLRGFEGSIARNYYSCFSLIFKNFSFENRNRQPPTDEINCVLSFGNCVLYNEVTNMIYEVGLDLFLGFVHEINGNKPTLTLDISEIFKQPIIDSLIFEMVNNNQFNEKHFNKKENICLLNNYGKNLFLRKYEIKLNKTFLYRKIKEYVSYKNSIKLDLYKLIKYLSCETNEFEGFRIY